MPTARYRPLLFSAGFMLAGATAWAHTSSISAGAQAWWSRWNVDPLILANLAWFGAAYFAGWRQLRAQRATSSPVRPMQARAFGAGLCALFVALISPVDILAVELLWVHMVQHMILMNLAAPLLVLGAPIRTILWAFPPAFRQLFGRSKRRLHQHGLPRRLLWQPLLLWILYGAVLWVWHLPGLYEAALHQEWLHDAQHLMFFAASMLFWRVMFDPIGRLQLSRGLGVLYLFTTSLHATMLGVFMALAPRLWYPAYAERSPAWGLDALADQQLAGYIMWMPACMAYAAVAAVVFARWLHEGNPKDSAHLDRATHLDRGEPRRQPGTGPPAARPLNS